LPLSGKITGCETRMTAIIFWRKCFG
jgi:hypothetical protein